MLAMLERPLGNRSFWPIYAAAERHDLPIVVHAGSLYRSAPTSIGWPSYFLEDYVNYSGAFESQLLSLISEGVFVKFPNLKVVFAEAGFCWLPAFMWRANKAWRGIRAEVPWVKEHPSTIVRRHVRFTLQPIDDPPDESQLEQVIEQIRCDDLFLFSTDYPHWQFDGLDAVPKPFGPIARKMLWDNPLATYPRLKETLG
jgi:predicted TIM-barrel fold metal-dependent hydrolase